MTVPNTPRQKTKLPKHVLDLVRSTKAKLAEKRKAKLSAKPLEMREVAVQNKDDAQ
jgi:hypothetical protein